MNDNRDGVIDEFKRSEDGIFNISLFLSSYQDVMIYVEDTDIPNVYETILKKLVGKGIRIDQIHMAGGKLEVEKLYRKYLGAKDYPCIFIVDLDFDLLLNKPLIEDINYVYLKRYSIENYLVNEDLGVNFLSGRLQIDSITSKSKLDFQNWLNSFSLEYKYLVILFLVIQELGLPLANTGAKVEVFLEDGKSVLSESKVNEYYERCLEAVGENKNKFNDLVDYYDREVSSKYGERLWEIIPGKHLISAFMKYLKELCPSGKKTIYLEDLYHTGAQTCNSEELDFIIEKINGYFAEWLLRH